MVVFLLRLTIGSVEVAVYWLFWTAAVYCFWANAAVRTIVGSLFAPGGFERLSLPGWPTWAMAQVLADPSFPYACVLAAGIVIFSCVLLLVVTGLLIDDA